jgi:hypothetical protein
MCDGGTESLDPGGAAVPCNQAPLLRFGNGFGIPKHEGNFNASLTMFGNLRLYALVDWQGEHYRTLTDASCRHTCFWTSEVAVKRHELDEPWAPFAVAAIDGMITTSPYTNTFNAAFARLREVSASYTLPDQLVQRTGASRASLNVAARNLGFLYRAQTHISGASYTIRKHAGSLAAARRAAPGTSTWARTPTCRPWRASWSRCARRSDAHFHATDEEQRGRYADSKQAHRLPASGGCDDLPLGWRARRRARTSWSVELPGNLTETDLLQPQSATDASSTRRSGTSSAPTRCSPC